jgi:predicted Na+-dependent transporter
MAFARLADGLAIDRSVSAGLVLVAASPAAFSSALWARLAGGSVPVVVLATMISTLAAPLVTPFLLSAALGARIPIAAGPLALDLALTVLVPCSASIALTRRAPALAKRLRPPLLRAAQVVLLLLIGINVGLARERILALGASVALVLAMVGAQTVAGFGLGAVLGWRLGGRAGGLGVAYAAGMRNNGVGAVIALAHFPPAAGIPVALTILVQQPLAALIERLLRRPAAVASGQAPSAGSSMRSPADRMRRTPVAAAETAAQARRRSPTANR